MQKFIYRISIVLVILFLINSCVSKIQKTIPLEQVTQYCNYIEITNSFDMKLLEYIHSGCYCGVRICASNCVGVTSNNDTIRVFSLCNTDSTYNINQIVKVTPQPKPSGQVTIAQNWVSEGNKTFLTSLQRKKFNTIFGNLSRK